LPDQDPVRGQAAAAGTYGNACSAQTFVGHQEKYHLMSWQCCFSFVVVLVYVWIGLMF
jgi:hypothetical protein